ncbi:hypothetical protein IU11_00260 [Cellulosimicrobium sp. MM]|nr:hypothetical protein [Cellulosimicrobium sp. MM]KFD44661.1 hypothetical protein IU11_00260 [Cellulosimicrobium sp. MM]
MAPVSTYAATEPRSVATVAAPSGHFWFVASTAGESSSDVRYRTQSARWYVPNAGSSPTTLR